MTDKIYAYFDNITMPNLSKLSNQHNKPWLTFNNPEIISLLKNNGLEISNTNDYQGPGIYLVSVRQDAHHWTGCTQQNNKHVLSFISDCIINLAKEKKLIIVIDNSSEGKKIDVEGNNAFESTYRVMDQLGLPNYSVLIVNSNKKFFDEYDKWKMDHWRDEKLAHSYMINGFYYFDNRIPKDSLIKEAILNQNSSSFNSLNRTVRRHRVDHLYTIIENNWHRNNLVSGSYYDNFDNRETLNSSILNVNVARYRKKLSKNCPLHADGNWIQKNPDLSDQHIFNHDLYKHSLLSVVTETAFFEDGLFITEKTFKPIVAGHPFMILGQPFILQELREMGYCTDFHGINQSYDTIINTKDRFTAFHNSLKNWIDMPRHEKIENLNKSLTMIDHNRKIFIQNDYENDGIKSMLTTIRQIFQGKYRS